MEYPAECHTTKGTWSTWPFLANSAPCTCLSGLALFVLEFNFKWSRPSLCHYRHSLRFFKARAPAWSACVSVRAAAAALGRVDILRLLATELVRRSKPPAPQSIPTTPPTHPPLLLITTLRLISGGIPAKYYRRTQVQIGRSSLSLLFSLSLSAALCELSSRKLGRKQREIAGCCPCSQGDNLICPSYACCALNQRNLNKLGEILE